MIKLEHVVLSSADQMKFIIQGLRNPMNSWDKSDSYENYEAEYDDDLPGVEIHHPYFRVGAADRALMQRLANSGTDHRKFMRMMPVYVRITAPLYWWKEFDTYKVGTVANSCSTMHKIQEKEFTLDDFSYEHLDIRTRKILEETIKALNDYRKLYIDYNPDDFEIKGCPSKKVIWWQMIQLLPSSYNQTRNVMMNYEVLANIYKSRKDHKLDEWREFCKWIEELPYSELICGSPSLRCFGIGKAAADGIREAIAKAVQDSKNKDLVEVTRCINCSYYISADDMKNDEMYKGYENILGCDGICTSTDKWTYETDFCSSGKEK